MMSPNQNRKHRGLRTQLVVADYFKAHGFPFAESTGAGRSGSDITGTPGLFIEVKARASFEPLAWVKQANAMATLGGVGLPLVTFRPNGCGETTVSSWPCLIRLADLVGLLREAGYGTPAPDDNKAATA